jgi:hypothetical protein
MSVGIATMGMFNPCCGTSTGGGGAPPYKQNEEEIVFPSVLVTSVEHKSKKMFDSIRVKLIDDGGYE